MAIGFNFRLIFCSWIVIACSNLNSWAEDQIFLKKGDPVKGEIQEIKDGKVLVKLAAGTIPYPLDTIERVIMEERPSYHEGADAAASGDENKAIKILKPLVDKYIGLEVGWVADAAVYLAESYAKKGKTFKAEQLAEQILSLYRGSEYEVQGNVVTARLAFVKGDLEKAAILTEKLIQENTPKDEPIPDESKTRLLSSLTFQRAQIQEKKGQKADALESYLKVALIYSKPQSRAQAAQKRADLLRKDNKDLTVN
ncbi:MAG: hypothetical protein AAGA18_08765 [Verrucomicrobiota bacterium]